MRIKQQKKYTLKMILFRSIPIGLGAALGWFLIETRFLINENE